MTEDNLIILGHLWSPGPGAYNLWGMLKPQEKKMGEGWWNMKFQIKNAELEEGSERM